MTLFIRCGIITTALLLPLSSLAHCPLEATAGAPPIPRIADTNYEQVKALGPEVEHYLQQASRKLAACPKTDNSLLYNAAVAELEDIASRYNDLTQAYNQDLAQLR